ncbi:MAG: nicotinate-nucleotide adenylyltransferase [Candidatus Eiseniibacteriota bacterium]
MTTARRERRERLGILGGTFDPPHLGHLMLAECARETLSLDRVLFVPARHPPHKRDRRVSPPPTRIRLLRAALRGTGFSISSIELERTGLSYTVDTLLALRERHRSAALFLLVGEDSLVELPTWRAPQRILELATVAVACRPGASGMGARRIPAAWRKRVTFLPNAPVDIASRDLRERVRRGRSIRFLVPDTVARLIDSLGLYR